MKFFSPALAIILTLAAGIGCSSSSGGNPDGSTPDGTVDDDSNGDQQVNHNDVCQDNPFDPLCGEECISTVDCGDNLHCGPDGTCIAYCTPGGDECGPNSFCIQYGQCAEECASVSVELELIMPTVILLIDQSGSMTDNFSGMERWDAVKQALTHSQDAVVPALQNEILFGAALYTSQDGFEHPDGCPLLTKVAPSLGNADPIKLLLDENQPEDDTPTGDSIVATVDWLESLPPEDITTLKVIVLATDGQPDTCEQPDPQDGEQESIEGAQDAFDRGVQTIILSVGPEVAEEHLQDMANAGAGLEVDGATDEPYFVANDPAELSATFEEIIGGVRSCFFALDGEVQPPEYAAYGEVTLNGTVLDYDDPDGWRLADPGTLELLGAACQAYLADDDPALGAAFPCGAIWVP